jgi:hypothetical protein
MILELHPLHGGSYTQLSLTGPVPSSPQGLRDLLALFALWNGYPVGVVLFVDAQSSGWCEVWSDAFASLPERNFSLEFRATAARHEPPTGKTE